MSCAPCGVDLYWVSLLLNVQAKHTHDNLFIKIIHVYSIHLVLKVSNLLVKVFLLLIIVTIKLLQEPTHLYRTINVIIKVGVNSSMIIHLKNQQK